MIQVEHGPIDSCAYKTVSDQFSKDVFMLALTILDDRCKDHDLLIFFQVQHLVNHLADRLGIQRVSVFGASRLSDAGE